MSSLLAILQVLPLLPLLEALLHQAWRYVEIDDDRLCDDCRSHAGAAYDLSYQVPENATEEERKEAEKGVRRHFEDLFAGEFPDGEWENEETYRVNLHINCRCKIDRSIDRPKLSKP